MARLVRPDAVLVQAVIAGALSFAHLHDLAAAAGQDGWKAWAYPVSVDLLLVAAWRRLRSLRDAGASTGPAWTWFTVALAASLGANVATAGLLDLAHVPDWLRILVAGWPALAFLGGTLLVHPHAASPLSLNRLPCLALCLSGIRLTSLNPLRHCPRRFRRCRVSSLRRPSLLTPRSSPPITAPAPARRSTPRPCAPGSAYRSRWQRPSPSSSSEGRPRCLSGTRSTRS